MQNPIQLGANTKAQAVCFALCLSVGIASGVFALLYFKKASFVERIFTDLFATLTIGGSFVACIEFFLDGKFELYGAVAFLIGVCTIPFLRYLIASTVKRKRQKSKQKDDDGQKDL